MTLPTLQRRQSPLADAGHQLRILSDFGARCGKSFDECLADQGLAPLHAREIRVLQVNLGKLCNQTCRHCHVDAGPERREVMDLATVKACLGVLARTPISVLDITGGAPEMNPHFRLLAAEGRRLGRHVIDRCNLTILLAPGFQDLPRFLADQGIEVVASLPCYLERNTDRQRGEGVFQKSIAALRALNDLGYGDPASGLVLTLVYNPLGPMLPPPQETLEEAYRKELWEGYDVRFTRLYTMTNMPISRFLEDLLESGQYESYMRLLLETFNPASVASVMCRTTLSVDWRGGLHDCDFNQMLDLGVAPGLPRTIFEFESDLLAHRPIQTGQHCLGCTAGRGSGCQGAILVDSP